MNYRAVFDIDVTSPVPSEYQKLIAALLQQGWLYLETSAPIREGTLVEVLRALEPIAKQAPRVGTVSAITLHIQRSADFNGGPYPAAANHPHAVSDIRARQFP